MASSPPSIGPTVVADEAEPLASLVLEPKDRGEFAVGEAAPAAKRAEWHPGEILERAHASSQRISPWNANSFITPTTLRSSSE